MRKCPTGISGLDEILGGGLPRGGATLVCGGAGCGKTILALEFLCRGIEESGEPGVFIAFEESPEELAANSASLGFDLAAMQASGQLVVDHLPLDREKLSATGGFDLEGLLLRVAAAVDEVGARRVAIDTIEILFAALDDVALVRSELKRLFGWLKERGLTTVLTSERGTEGRVSRFGIEEYVSDCVILLDHRITDQRSTRRLRVMKYRGSAHASDEYPFVIFDRGLMLLPISSLHLDQPASTERISTGNTQLDAILSGGVFRGSTVLVSGPSGAGKSSFVTHFADGSCRRGERTLYLSYEESADQIIRNMGSVGFDLGSWVEMGLLRFDTVRPTLRGLEGHLQTLHQTLDDFEPELVVIDPISALLRAGTQAQVAETAMRIVDTLKSRGVTAVVTALTQPDVGAETDLEVSSIVDTWLLTETVESNGERNRILRVVKSRGMAHSNQLSEFTLGETGVELLEPYVGPAGVLTGSARLAQESIDSQQRARLAEDLAARQELLDRRRAAIEAQVAALWADYQAEAEAFDRQQRAYREDEAEQAESTAALGRRRWATRSRD